ncbi:AraC family transcriptional regulator [Psychromonas marina]|uniref:AraC family transcriptional regulator n=1 Tax=Psychromonas marina TaxID=88364 RepID=A0ABQ6E3H1_9GAMM|nr:AraC family transcriptional regulator [Psychromonas marina]GLS91745.1 AraC family transcriptional regulator [Psychromonas marina]
MKPITEWHDKVYLSDACKELFLTTSDIPELHQEGFFMAGIAELKEGYHVERKGVDIHTLLFTLEGSGILTTGDRVELIKPNTLLVLPAHIPFRFELNPDEDDWKMVWLLPLVIEKWENLAALGQTILPYHQCKKIWSLTNLIHDEINGKSTFRHLLVSELKVMLSGVESTSTRSVSRVHTLFNDIESQLHLPWTVKEMAAQCFISEEQLNRITKKLYGMSPRSRLIDLRMEKAADLLRHREWTISMIAQRLGYKDPYNFSHRFRKNFGCSPSRYRKNIIAEQK